MPDIDIGIGGAARKGNRRRKSRESAKRETRPDETPRLSRRLDLPRLHARSEKLPYLTGREKQRDRFLSLNILDCAFCLVGLADL